MATRPERVSGVASDVACATVWTIGPTLLPRSSVSCRRPAATDTAIRDAASILTAVLSEAALPLNRARGTPPAATIEGRLDSA